MGFTIKIVSAVAAQNKVVDCVYTYKGKEASKKLPLWGPHAPVGETIKSSSTGDLFEIETTKNDRGFSDWTKATYKGSDQGSAEPSVETNTSRPLPGRSSGNSYPSVEERARTQVYIVRQSSISAAVEILKSRGEPFGVAEVTEEAARLVKWVMDTDVDAGD